MSLSLITVNVGAPSIERAHRQLRWLAARPEDVLVLTETRAAAGSMFLAETFTAAGYSVTFPEHAAGELGVMIVSGLATTVDPLGAAMDYLPARTAGVVVDTTDGPLRVVGAYVPSRDATPDKTERKRTWIERFHTALDTTASDARCCCSAISTCWNRPTGPRTGDSSRPSKTLVERLTSCEYVHETREVMPDGSRLTDHSGLTVRVALTVAGPLLTSDPTTAVVQDEPEPALF
ncbi:MAG: endonuclease/exonuclease/phosphatase family protein [Pseudonocardiaceae bacterium]